MRLAWAENHPVREAYQAHQKMPYDAPLASAAAVLHAARPESEWFTLSPPGVIEVLDTGATRFSASASGSHRTLKLAANQREAAVQGIIELVAAQPPAASGRGGRGGGKQE
jgi:hypothetical protein